jgi:hypothetical protein
MASSGLIDNEKPPAMTKSSEAIEYFLARLRDGKFDFFGFLELGATVIPELVNAYHRETDDRCRAFLVEVIWQYRDPSAIPFLAEALRDDSAEAWKEAIDGLVAMPCEESLQTLRVALSTVTGKRDVAKRREWIQEAIEQVSEIL